MPKETRQEYALRRAHERGRTASAAQVNYLQILFNDLGFGERAQRNAFLSRRFERDIVWVDSLTFAEAHTLIEELKAKKVEQRGGRSNEG